MCHPSPSLTILISLAGFATLSADEVTVLPFIGTDVIRLVDRSGRESRISGSIEDIQGQTLTFRRGNEGSVQFLRISDVSELDFVRSDQWNKGLRERSAKNFRRALALFDEALNRESRSWAWVELQAIATRTLIQMGRRREALDRLLTIESRDKRSRHFGLAPLVWDERLPDSERLMMNSSELRDKSPLVRLAAASSLLQERLYQADAVSVLEKLRRSGPGVISELAATQLWRLPLVNASSQARPMAIWRDRIRSMPVECRHGPSFVLGRCLQQQNDHDAAVVPLLWCAVMSPTDPALAAISLAEAIRSHHVTGRTEQEKQLQRELTATFGRTHFAHAFVRDQRDQ